MAYYRFTPVLRFMALLLLIVSLPAAAQTSLWIISKDGHMLYLGGTVHVLEQADYPLPSEFSQAFARAQKVVFETDIKGTKQAAFAQKMMQQMSLPEGRTLRDVLPEFTYKKLSDYIANQAVMAQIDELKPAMVVIILFAMEFQRLGMSAIGVDEYFWMRAQQQHKKIAVLETLDEQLAFLVTMGKGNENEFILNSLNELGDTDVMVKELKKVWRAGDEAAMETIMLQELTTTYPRLHQSLLVKRNKNWLPKLEKMLKTNTIELVLVGALHLVGEHGLLQLLRNRGYTVSYFFKS